MANSNITVANCRASFCNFQTGFNGSGDANFIPALNQVCERLIYSGKWKGNVEKVVFGVQPVNFITLPPHFISVLGGGYDCWPGVPIWSQFHEFMECGPGTWDAAFWNWPYQFVDMGDQFVTQLDVTTTGNIQLFSSASDNGVACRVFGLSAATGLPVYDSATGDEGEPLVLASPHVQSVNQFASVTGFQKAATKNTVAMWVNPGSNAYQIGTYQPFETNPQYHRYQIQNVQAVSNGNPAIRTLCQRRFIPVQAESDWVYPGNLGALKYGLQALNYEDLNRNADALQAWAYAYQLLNNQSKSSRGGARIELEIEPFGPGCGGLPWTN